MIITFWTVSFWPVIMLLILIMTLIPVAEKRKHKIVLVTVVCVISSLLILQPLKSQQKRREIGFGIGQKQL